MRERLTLTQSSRRWTVVGIVFTTAVVTAMTLLDTIEHESGWLLAVIAMVVMIGFPAIAGVHVSRLRGVGEHVAADALLTLTLGALISIYLGWATGSLPP